MNGEEIHVSGVRDIKDAFVFAELPYNAQQYKQTALHLIDKLYGVVGGIRMNGSAAAVLMRGRKLFSENGIIRQRL